VPDCCNVSCGVVAFTRRHSLDPPNPTPVLPVVVCPFTSTSTGVRDVVALVDAFTTRTFAAWLADKPVESLHATAPSAVAAKRPVNKRDDISNLLHGTSVQPCTAAGSPCCESRHRQPLMSRPVAGRRASQV
jgi:hypothetical protein